MAGQCYQLFARRCGVAMRCGVVSRPSVALVALRHSVASLDATSSVSSLLESKPFILISASPCSASACALCIQSYSVLSDCVATCVLQTKLRSCDDSFSSGKLIGLGKFPFEQVCYARCLFSGGRCRKEM